MKMYPLALIWLISWNYALKGMIEVNSQKTGSKLYHIPHSINHVASLVKNIKTIFSKLAPKMFMLVSGEQVSKQVESSK